MASETHTEDVCVMKTCSEVGWYQRFGVINCFYLQEAGEGMASLSLRCTETYFLAMYNKVHVVYQMSPLHIIQN